MAVCAESLETPTGQNIFCNQKQVLDFKKFLDKEVKKNENNDDL